MNDNVEALVPTDAELRALWQQAGGTIYSANREIGSMPVRALLPFLRRTIGTERLVLQVNTNAGPAASMIAAAPASVASAPSPAPVKDSVYAAALMKLIAAACPGLDTGNLLEDARKATEAFAAAELAGHFGVDDEPASDGGARYVMVERTYAGDPDIVPLFRRAALQAAAPAPSAARKVSKAAAK